MTTIAPSDPNVLKSDRPRLSAQCATVLAILQEGPATTDQLSRVSRKYTSRISDLREAGYTITCQRRAGGNNLYSLAQ